MKKITLFAFALLMAISASAASIPEQIMKLHKAGEQFSGQFTEVKTMPKLKKETSKAGQLTFTAPNDLRLDYTDPAGDYTLIGKDLFEVSRGGKVQKFPVKNPEHRMAILRATLLLAMQGNVEEVAKTNSATADCKQQGGQFVCTLTASKDAKHGISSLTLIYDKKTGRLISLTLTENNGNYTTYKL